MEENKYIVYCENSNGDIYIIGIVNNENKAKNLCQIYNKLDCTVAKYERIYEIPDNSMNNLDVGFSVSFYLGTSTIRTLYKNYEKYIYSKEEYESVTIYTNNDEKSPFFQFIVTFNLHMEDYTNPVPIDAIELAQKYYKEIAIDVLNGVNPREAVRKMNNKIKKENK